MKISSQNWGGSVDAAYYTFANAHGDVSVLGILPRVFGCGRT